MEPDYDRYDWDHPGSMDIVRVQRAATDKMVDPIAHAEEPICEQVDAECRARARAGT